MWDLRHLTTLWASTTFNIIKNLIMCPLYAILFVWSNHHMETIYANKSLVGKLKNTDQFADVGTNLRGILTWILVNEVERTRVYPRVETYVRLRLDGYGT
jgi:hypothetical protein